MKLNATINYENAIVNRGNQERLKKLMKRAKEGAKLTIGFIGGSITMGSVSSTPQLCYAYHVFSWWKKMFPKSEMVYVNAGIGATDSQFGCARVQSDLLDQKPDFVIVEFSVNDSSTSHYMETYEGLVRRILCDENEPAVLLVHNVCYDTGANAQLMHGKVARYYDLPAVSMQSSIYPELLAGHIENRQITPDDLHPNDEGHALVASVITYFLDQVYASLDESAQETTWEMKKSPLTRNAYEHSVRYQNTNSNPVCDGFEADMNPQNGITDLFKKGWVASRKGARIVFEMEAQCLALQYRKTMQLPAPVAQVVVDDDREHAILLDANFDETWGDKMEMVTIFEGDRKAKHRIEITLVTTHEKDCLPFYLVSVIGS